MKSKREKQLEYNVIYARMWGTFNELLHHMDKLKSFKWRQKKRLIKNHSK